MILEQDLSMSALNASFCSVLMSVLLCSLIDRTKRYPPFSSINTIYAISFLLITSPSTPSMFCIIYQSMMLLFDVFKVNINRNGHWNRLHTHAGASWSGVYYIKSLEDSLLRDYRYLLGHCTLHIIHLA